ncbi:MAG: hypothetical protein ACI8RN_001618, partial [Glaciecola sp.]
PAQYSGNGACASPQEVLNQRCYGRPKEQPGKVDLANGI